MIVAATPWADATIAVAGIALVASIAVVIIWQIFSTGRAAMSIKRELAYKTLAEESAEHQRVIATELEKTASELSQLRKQTAELERMLKEVE
jgi:small-conductance mechanosensitive channel